MCQGWSTVLGGLFSRLLQASGFRCECSTPCQETLGEHHQGSQSPCGAQGVGAVGVYLMEACGEPSVSLCSSPPLPLWRELSTAQMLSRAGPGLSKTVCHPHKFLSLEGFLLSLLNSVFVFLCNTSVKGWVYGGKGWELKLFLRYWRSDLEKESFQFYKETKPLPAGLGDPWSRTDVPVAAAQLGWPEKQHLLPKGRTDGVSWGQDFAAPGCSAGGCEETLPLQLGAACTALSKDPYFEEYLTFILRSHS